MRPGSIPINSKISDRTGGPSGTRPLPPALVSPCRAEPDRPFRSPLEDSIRSEHDHETTLESGLRRPLKLTGLCWARFLSPWRSAGSEPVCRLLLPRGETTTPRGREMAIPLPTRSRMRRSSPRRGMFMTRERWSSGAVDRGGRPGQGRCGALRCRGDRRQRSDSLSRLHRPVHDGRAAAGCGTVGYRERAAGGPGRIAAGRDAGDNRRGLTPEFEAAGAVELTDAELVAGGGKRGRH